MNEHGMRTLAETPLAEIVNADPRAAIVFDQFGLDYCCRGGETLDTAARKQGLEVGAVAREIDALGPPSHESLDEHWPDLPGLVNHIVSAHHKYIRDTQPVIAAWLDKLVERHGPSRPELAQVRDLFATMSTDLFAHMIKEEQILFPYIVDLATRSAGTRPVSSPFGTIQNPIRAMEHEHLEAGDAFARLRELTAGFEPPDTACTTYRLCYRELARFERDLHRHVHLENHVLFPRAVRLEEAGA
jgi:regulator of cell morphogenesis and NO signaling